MKNAPNLDLSLLARQWGASAVPFGELSTEAWLETPSSQRALGLLDQTAALRSVMLLAGPNGVGKSALVGRWLSRLDRRLFCPLLVTQASLSGCGLLSALAARLGKRATFRREANLALMEAALAELGKPMPDELPLMREIFVARTRAEAVRLARPYLEEKYKVYQQWGQQKAMPKGDDDLSLDFDELTRDRFLLGSSDEVAEQIVGYNRRLGVNRMILSVHWVGMPHAQVVDTLNLFATEVMPKVAQAL